MFKNWWQYNFFPRSTPFLWARGPVYLLTYWIGINVQSIQERLVPEIYSIEPLFQADIVKYPFLYWYIPIQQRSHIDPWIPMHTIICLWQRVFTLVVFMKKRWEFPWTLKEFAKELGVVLTTSLIRDPLGEQPSKQNKYNNFHKNALCHWWLLKKVLSIIPIWPNVTLNCFLKIWCAQRYAYSKYCLISLWDYCIAIARRVHVHNITATACLQLAILTTWSTPPQASSLSPFYYYSIPSMKALY